MENSLPPEHVFQESDSNTCGPSSLAMIYRMKGKDISVKEILGDFYQEGKGEATFAPQLARHLHSNGINTRLIVSSSKIVSPAWKDLEANAMIKNMKSWLTHHPKAEWHLNNLHLLFYLQEGGKLDIESYTADILRNVLDKGSKLIVCVDEGWLWGHRIERKDGIVKINDEVGKLEGHFVVVTGYEGNKFHILDPFPTGISESARFI